MITYQTPNFASGSGKQYSCHTVILVCSSPSFNYVNSAYGINVFFIFYTAFVRNFLFPLNV